LKSFRHGEWNGQQMIILTTAKPKRMR
jgi:hypothetical protein